MIPAVLEYYPDHFTHGHSLIFDAEEQFTGEMMEELSSELAEAVQVCNEGRHDGHGRKHSHDDVQAAFHHSMSELMTKDAQAYQEEWEDAQQKQRAYQRWGGPVPAAVLLPDQFDAKRWSAIIPDKEGVPYIYKVNEKALGIGQELPAPSAENARQGEFGWEALPHKDRAARRRLERAFNKAQHRG